MIYSRLVHSLLEYPASKTLDKEQNTRPLLLRVSIVWWLATSMTVPKLESGDARRYFTSINHHAISHHRWVGDVTVITWFGRKTPPSSGMSAMPKPQIQKQQCGIELLQPGKCDLLHVFRRDRQDKHLWVTLRTRGRRIEGSKGDLVVNCDL